MLIATANHSERFQETALDVLRQIKIQAIDEILCIHLRRNQSVADKRQYQDLALSVIVLYKQEPACRFLSITS